MARKSKIDGEDEVEIHDEDESEEIQTGKEVSTGVSLIRMWPRAIFTTSEPPGQGQRGKPPTIAFNIKLLDSPGVYVLYRDDQPYYVGQTKGKLRSRLRRHAAGVGIRSYF